MKWYVYAASALGALILGTAAAYINMRLSKKVLKKENFAGIMGINVLRLTNDAAVLAVVFFVCRSFGLPLELSLISAAVGLTLLGMLFLEKMTKHATHNGSDGGE